MIESPATPPLTPSLNAADIPVRAFREILIWPLVPHVPPVRDQRSPNTQMTSWVADRLTRLAAQSDKATWRPVDDPTHHIPPPAQADGVAQARWRAERFAEAVYFHEFVQSFLFFPRDAAVGLPHDRALFRLFQRSDITGVTVTMANRMSLALTVERLNLYLFRTGAAILVLEVAYGIPPAIAGERSGDAASASEPAPRVVSLADVQDFHDSFRRAYVPFAYDNREGNQPVTLPNLVVRGVTWHLAGGGEAPFKLDDSDLATMISAYLEPRDTRPDQRPTPLFAHWAWLLREALPLDGQCWGHERPPVRDAAWHHVTDERLPTILSVSVTASDPDALLYYRAVSRNDLIRLCFADPRGKPDSTPYAAETLTGFEQDNLYAAFRPDGSLFMSSGFAFVALGADAFFDNTIMAIHMRRHYFQICLLAQHEFAALLGISSRITRVVGLHDPAEHGDETLEEAMQGIEDDYLDFIHRFHFTGASNHVQAVAMSKLIRRHLGLDALHHDLRQELQSATQYLFNRAASRAAATTEHLSFIGLFGVVASVAIALLSLTLLTERPELVKALARLRGQVLPPAPATEAAAAGASTVGPSAWGADQAMLFAFAFGLIAVLACVVSLILRFVRGRGPTAFWASAARREDGRCARVRARMRVLLPWSTQSLFYRVTNWLGGLGLLLIGVGLWLWFRV